MAEKLSSISKYLTLWILLAMAVIGPLIEVPVMLGLVHVAGS